ncbi:hypothetical protein JAAARDRAFT_38491 [Jaapia argillacea MUCL 33604]|uniref:Uncharacterized protein n=1 Tax=Jaapia argillacea MUCL 33604 TaxID=933084 RepID=A0A067PHN8_9AGAM|nr:hypothetical protein JAAARDRAFT_38491 [Jaapia argillacea MUCL 33604]
MAEYDDVSPSEISAYLNSRNRITTWVKSSSTREDFYSPSVPPSRMPSYYSDEPEEEDDDLESNHSMPPQMVLRYGNGRPDELIPSYERAAVASHNPGYSYSRSRTISQPLPPPGNYRGPVEEFSQYAPPTPQFPEDIRILPPRTPSPNSRPAVTTRPSYTSSASSRPTAPPIQTSYHPQVRPPPVGYSQSHPLPSRPVYQQHQRAQSYQTSHSQHPLPRSHTPPASWYAPHRREVPPPLPQPYNASPQPSSRPATMSHPHSTTLPPPHRTDSKTCYDYPYWGGAEGGDSRRSNTRGRAETVIEEERDWDDRGRSVPRPDLQRSRSRAASMHSRMHEDPRSRHVDGMSDGEYRRNDGQRSRKMSMSSGDTYYVTPSPGERVDAHPRSQSSLAPSPTSTKHSPTSNYSQSQAGSLKKPFFQRLFHWGPNPEDDAKNSVRARRNTLSSRA